MNALRKVMTKPYDLHTTTEKETPKKGLLRLFYLLRNEAGKLILLNLIFVISCLPVFTIPAAICAQNRYLMKMVRDGYGFSLDDYRKEFRTELLRSIPTGALFGAVFFYAYYLLSFAGQLPGIQGRFSVMIAVICLIVATVVSAYTFVLLSQYDMPLLKILKMAGLIALAQWQCTLKIIVAAAIFFSCIFLFLPLSVIYLLIAGCSVLQLTVCCFIAPVLEKYQIA